MKISNGWFAVRTELEGTLDRHFSLSEDRHYHFDSILSLEEMQKLEYTRNFPHLTCLGCSLPSHQYNEFSEGKRHLDQTVQPVGMDFALLPATCYKIYLGLSDAEITETQYFGCIASCFRHEDKPLDDYRAFNFTMKEFVCVGVQKDAQEHLTRSMETTSELLNLLAIPFEVEVANDPFFDSQSSQAVLASLAPTKRELVYNGHAIASANFHRNYFGEKFAIKINDQHVTTSCMAFGLERWISMLAEVFETPQRALDALKGTYLPSPSIEAKVELRENAH